MSIAIATRSWTRSIETGRSATGRAAVPDGVLTTAVKLIPGEVIAFFSAATAYAKESLEKPGSMMWVWVIAAAVAVTPLTLWGISRIERKRNPRAPTPPAAQYVLRTIACLLWTLAIVPSPADSFVAQRREAIALALMFFTTFAPIIVTVTDGQDGEAPPRPRPEEEKGNKADDQSLPGGSVMDGLPPPDQIPVPTINVGAFDLESTDATQLYVKVISTGSAVSGLPPGWVPQLGAGHESWYRTPGSIPSTFRIRSKMLLSPSDLSPLTNWLGNQATWRGRDEISALSDWSVYTGAPGVQKYTLKFVRRNGTRVVPLIANQFAVSFEALDNGNASLHWYRKIGAPGTPTTPFYDQTGAFVPLPDDYVEMTAVAEGGLGCPASGTWQQRTFTLMTT